MTAAAAKIVRSSPGADVFLKLLDQPPVVSPEFRLWQRWRKACRAGALPEAALVEAIERAVCRTGSAITFGADSELLQPHQLLRLAMLAWPSASAEERRTLVARLGPVLRELFLPYVGPPSPTSTIFTTSQQSAFQRVTAYAEAFFAQVGQKMQVQPRFQPLLIGPTGVGKTALARRVAQDCGATLVHVTTGAWIPIGARGDVWTAPMIANAAVSNDRVVLLVDELDKERSAFDTFWSQSILAEVFAILDGSLPASIPRPKGLGVAEVELRLKRNVFKIGAGTWQSIWRAKSPAGFVPQQTPVEDSIGANPLIPEELLFRFSTPPIVLQYPNPQETAELFERLGLVQLARQAGVTLKANEHDWTRGGMRTLESLATELLLQATAITTATFNARVQDAP